MLKTSVRIADAFDVVSHVPPTSVPPPGAKPLWGTYKGSAVTSAIPPAAPGAPARTAGTSWLFGGEELEPLSRNLLQLAGFLSLLLVLVVANSFLNQGSASPFNPNPVAQAAERTQDLSGARFTMKIVGSSEAQPSPDVLRAGGSFNLETGMVRMQMHGPMEGAGTIDAEAITDGSEVYIRSPEFAGKLPEGKEWAKLKSLLSQGDASAPSESPDDTLRMLRASGGVRRVGHERVRGVPTTRYRAYVDTSTYADQLRAEGKDEVADQFEEIEAGVAGPVRVEASVDRKQILRRFHMVMTMTANGAPVRVEMNMDLFDFHTHPDIQAPDDSQVFDLTPLLEKQQEATGAPS